MTGPDRTALIVVDVQNDFCEGGSLAVDGGAAVAAAISRHLADGGDRYAVVAASLDFHHAGDDNGGHFAVAPARPDFVTSWPVHCVADSPGAEPHPDLEIDRIGHWVRKGQGRPAYSAFEGVDDTGVALEQILRRQNITRVEICGLATDYCVRATALAAAGYGFTTSVRLGLTAAVDPTQVDRVTAELTSAGVRVAD